MFGCIGGLFSLTFGLIGGILKFIFGFSAGAIYELSKPYRGKRR